MTAADQTGGGVTPHRMAERLALAALDYQIPARANRLDFMLGALTLRG